MPTESEAQQLKALTDEIVRVLNASVLPIPAGWQVAILVEADIPKDPFERNAPRLRFVNGTWR